MTTEDHLLWFLLFSDFWNQKCLCVFKIPLFPAAAPRKNIPQPSVWNKRAWYCWDAEQMIALCSSTVRRLLPNVDGIIGFRPPRHLHWVVYRPNGITVRTHCGKRSHSHLTVDPIRSNNGSFLRQWKHEIPQKISRFKGGGSYHNLSNCNQTQSDVSSTAGSEETFLGPGEGTPGWWHQLLGIIAMLSSTGCGDWMRHEEVIQGDIDTTTQRLFTPKAN